MSLLLVLSLAGCIHADAGHPATPPTPVGASSELTFDELLYVDVRGATQAMEMVRDDVRALSPEARAEVAESMSFLARNCPFTRASIQLPRAMQRAFVQTPLGEVDGFAQSDWSYLRRGLNAHVATLDAMGAHLPLPETGDYLFRDGDAAWLVDPTDLAQADDPVATTALLLDRVDELVDGIDEATMASIRFHTARVDHHIGHSWTLSNHLTGWSDAVRRVEPFVSDPGPQRTVQQILDALGTYGMQGC